MADQVELSDSGLISPINAADIAVLNGFAEGLDDGHVNPNTHATARTDDDMGRLASPLETARPSLVLGDDVDGDVLGDGFVHHGNGDETMPAAIPVVHETGSPESAAGSSSNGERGTLPTLVQSLSVVSGAGENAGLLSLNGDVAICKPVEENDNLVAT